MMTGLYNSMYAILCKRPLFFKQTAECQLDHRDKKTNGRTEEKKRNKLEERKGSVKEWKELGLNNGTVKTKSADTTRGG